MGIEVNNPELKDQLYPEFRKSLSADNQKKLSTAIKYGWITNVMKYFILGYYRWHVPSIVAKAILKSSDISFSKNNFQHISDSYKNFRDWAKSNPLALCNIRDWKYESIRADILWGSSNQEFQSKYSSWEWYLKNNEDAFWIRKELHCAYNARTIKYIFVKVLPSIFNHLDVKRDNSYASIFKANNEGLKGKDMFIRVVDKITDKEGLTWIDIRERDKTVLWTMADLRKRFYKIVWYYNAWYKICKVSVNEDVREVLEMKEDKWFRLGRLPNKWEIVDVVNGDYKNDDGDMQNFEAAWWIYAGEGK